MNPNVEADRRKSGGVKGGENLKLDTLYFFKKIYFQLKKKVNKERKKSAPII